MNDETKSSVQTLILENRAMIKKGLRGISDSYDLLDELDGHHRSRVLEVKRLIADSYDFIEAADKVLSELGEETLKPSISTECTDSRWWAILRPDGEIVNGHIAESREEIINWFVGEKLSKLLQAELPNRWAGANVHDLIDTVWTDYYVAGYTVTALRMK